MRSEDIAHAYAEATDGCRCLFPLGSDFRPRQRDKPDPETNPLADLDCEKVPTWDEHMPQATPLRASTCE
jgi:hypothetical protein